LPSSRVFDRPIADQQELLHLQVVAVFFVIFLIFILYTSFVQSHGFMPYWFLVQLYHTCGICKDLLLWTSQEAQPGIGSRPCIH